MLCHYFVICALAFVITSKAYALNLDSLKGSFLRGNYKAAISEGERLIVQNASAGNYDELYYLLGMSYLKDGNYLRASDIFEIILKEFKNSAFKEEAQLGLGDAYFVAADYGTAQDCYRTLVANYPKTKYLPLAYYRLSLCSAKLGELSQAQEYMRKVSKDFPLSLEIRNSQVPAQADNFYYTVQVGSFSKGSNAQNLTQELKQKGYPAFVEEVSLGNQVSYRVRVGKFSAQQEAVTVKNKLSQEGYPTRIYP